MDEIFGIEKIREIIPHRYPFLFVDRVVEIIEPDFIRGYKNISVNEAIFQGHFPANPVFPGVLIMEALAQLGAILMLRQIPKEKRMAYFTGIDKAKFRKVVIPGDRLDLEMKLVRQRGVFAQMEGKATVDGKIAATGILSSALA